MNIGSYSDLLASLFCLYFQNIVYVGRKLPRQMSCTVSNSLCRPAAMPTVPRPCLRFRLYMTDISRDKHSRLMAAIDRINEVQGRRTVVVASRGFSPIKMNRQHLSRNFTTDPDDIIRVKTESGD